MQKNFTLLFFIKQSTLHNDTVYSMYAKSSIDKNTMFILCCRANDVQTMTKI